MNLPARYHEISPRLYAPHGAKPFTYSDGDAAENHIAKVMAEATDRSLASRELTRAIEGWASLYHLTFRRSYLLRPVEHLLRGASVLELGAGCGAITRYLGETAKTVTALEGSPRRAGIVASRCRDLDAVMVVNDTIQDLELTEKFDVVTLIGVLEYARTFGPGGRRPEVEILKKALSFLKPGGRLLLAIENQLGLKYFAGAPEDHLGLPFFGIHDLYTGKTAVTFGRKELLGLLDTAGFRTVEQLVPLPDYKIPVTVLYPASLEDDPPLDLTPLVRASYRGDHQKASSHCFSLEAATGPVVRNGLLKDLCGSLFFVASPAADNPACDPDLFAAHYGHGRAAEFVKETLFRKTDGEIRVSRRYLFDDLPRDGRKIGHSFEDEAYHNLPVYHDLLTPLINMPGWTVDSVTGWAAPWADYLRKQAKDGDELPGRFLDALPANFLYTSRGGLIPFDFEWSPAGGATVPLAFVVFRGLHHSLSAFENVAPAARNTPMRLVGLVAAVMLRLGFPLKPGDVEELVRREIDFHARATNGISRVTSYMEQKFQVRVLT